MIKAVGSYVRIPSQDIGRQGPPECQGVFGLSGV